MNDPRRRLSAIFLVVFCFISTVAGHTQEATDASGKPPLPLVAQPKENAHWRMVSARLAADGVQQAAGGSPVVVSIEIWKSAAAARMVEKLSNGRSSERWIVDGYLLSKFAALPDIYVKRLGERSASLDDGMSDFNTVYPGFTWLDPGFFKGTVELNGRTCRHYVDSENNREAWVDAESNEPVAFRNGDARFSYEFLSAQAPVMPEAFRRELQNYRKADSQ